MKRIAFLLMVCVCVLTPAVARADDGGFWDMLFHWDTKFSGYGTEFHVACWDKSGTRVERCEEWFGNIPHFFHPLASNHRFNSFEEIRHELNFRVSLMHSYGQRVPDAKLAATDTKKDDTTRVYASKLMGFYNFRIDSHWNIGAGAGAIPVFGEGVDSLWRGIASVGTTYFPASASSPWGRWYIRVEESYLTNTLTGAGLGHDMSTFTSGPRFNFSATLGFDLRRVGNMGVR